MRAVGGAGMLKLMNAAAAKRGDHRGYAPATVAALRAMDPGGCHAELIAAVVCLDVLMMRGRVAGVKIGQQ